MHLINLRLNPFIKLKYLRQLCVSGCRCWTDTLYFHYEIPVPEEIPVPRQAAGLDATVVLVKRS